MEDKFLKLYTYLVIVVGLLNFFAGTIKLIYDHISVSILLGLATIVEFPLMLILSLIIIFYVYFKRYNKFLLILPIFYLVVYIIFLIYGMLSTLKGNNVLDLSNPENVTSLLLTDMYYLVQIIFAGYLLKRRGIFFMKREKRKPKRSNLFGIISALLGIISLIPLIGLFTGITAIVMGVVDRRKNKSIWGVLGIILGIIGIVITLGVGSFIYFVFMQRGGMYDNIRTELAKEQLISTINTIEAYKVRLGEYPQNITQLSSIGDKTVYIDQLQLGGFEQKEDVYFYYENLGDSYYLFSRGIDGIPFTNDDVYAEEEFLTGNIGYKRP
ncbi:hypothetical protein HYW21_05875 [Candidatus Woesearchaeota archaeon]|nr:hypothetical protein [Candidatus Woesearchaeota archaeon]